MLSDYTLTIDPDCDWVVRGGRNEWGHSFCLPFTLGFFPRRLRYHFVNHCVEAFDRGTLFCSEFLCPFCFATLGIMNSSIFQPISSSMREINNGTRKTRHDKNEKSLGIHLFNICIYISLKQERFFLKIIDLYNNVITHVFYYSSRYAANTIAFIMLHDFHIRLLLFFLFHLEYAFV